MGTYPSQRLPKRLRWTKFHPSTKNGPNGHALNTCLRDLNSLPDSLLESVKYVGGEDFSSRVQTLQSKEGQEIVSSLGFEVEPGEIRKLSYFPDKEGKTRTIAILDYWSQTVLKPLHSYLFSILKNIPQDRTFDQRGFKDLFQPGRWYYSVDLSNATDRFPITVIERVLRAKLPATYVDHWSNIMVGYPFQVTDNQGKRQGVSYSVGNPMGAYSSWASFALSNHYLVYYCCRELGKDWKSLPYALLGDDILIADEEVGKLYIQVIESLGVEVSGLKTHITPNLAEFAKRLFYKGQEISPFPISALRESVKRTFQFVNLLLESEEKGWVVHNDGIPLAISEYYGEVRNLPKRFRAESKVSSQISELMMKVMRGSLSATEAVNTCSRSLSIPVRQFNDEESLGILQSLAVEAFADANPENSKPGAGEPLGLLAERLVIILSGISGSDGLLGFNLIQSLPVLNIYGQVEEGWLKLKQEAIRIDTVGGGHWPLLLRSMTIPVSDRYFTERSVKTVVRASAVLGTKLIQRLKLISELGM